MTVSCLPTNPNCTNCNTFNPFSELEFESSFRTDSKEIPMNKVRIGNVRPIIVAKEGEELEEAKEIKLLIYASSGDVISEIRINNLSDLATPSDIIEMLYAKDAVPIEIPYPEDKEKTYSMLSSDALFKILNFCVNNSANIISPLGRTPKDITKNYKKVCKLETTRAVKISELQINKDSLRVLNPILNNRRASDISWTDIDTQHANQLDSPDSLEKYLANNYPEVMPEKDWKHTILDFRILNTGKSDCEVDRSKLMVIIGEDRIITVHDGSLDLINESRNRFLKNLYNRGEDYPTEVGSGFIFARLMEEIVETNEKTLRQLESTSRHIFNQLREAMPAELKVLLKDIETIGISSDYLLMKSSDAKDQFLKFAKEIQNGDLANISGSMEDSLVAEKIERLTTLLDGIINRGEALLRKTEKLAESHSTHISLHMDTMNSKLTLLGAALGPTIATATLIEILPNIISNPALVGLIAGGIISSATLLLVAKLKKLF